MSVSKPILLVCVFFTLCTVLLQELSFFKDLDRRLQRLYYVVSPPPPLDLLPIQLIALDDQKLQAYAEQTQQAEVFSPVPLGFIAEQLVVLHEKGVHQVFIDLPLAPKETLPPGLVQVIDLFEQVFWVDRSRFPQGGFMPLGFNGDGTLESLCLGPPCLETISEFEKLCVMMEGVECPPFVPLGWQRPIWSRSKGQMSVYAAWAEKPVASIPSEELENRLVVLFPNRSGIERTYWVPKVDQADERVHRGYVLAAGLESFVHQQWNHDLSPWWWGVVLLGCVLLLVEVGERSESRWLLFLGLLLNLLWWVVALILFHWGQSLPLLLPMLQLNVALLVLLGWQWYSEKEYRDQLKQKFAAQSIQGLALELNSHTLGNDLTLLKYSLKNSPDMAIEYLEAWKKVISLRLTTSAVQLIPLQKEWEYLQANIGLCELANGSVVKFDVRLQAGLSGVKIPFLTFYPLLENAIKYGLPTGTEASPCLIRIALTREADRLRFTIENPVSAGSKVDSTGKGLSNLVERLNYFYDVTNWTQTNSQTNDQYHAVLEVLVQS